MNVYLDIDGVILANDKQKANFADEFLKYIVDNHEVYWLTTHCMGDANYTLNFLNRFFDRSTFEILKKIKPTNWKVNKTEAINFAEPFLWFEDQLFEEEVADLKSRNAFANWIEVDLSKNVNQLRDIINNFPLAISL